MASTSTLSRYKPAIFMITGVVCAFGIYLVYQNARSQSPAASLHRSNAVYRRTRARPTRPVTNNTDGAADEAADGTAAGVVNGAADGASSVSRPVDPDGIRTYGLYRVISQDDSSRYLELRLPRLPTVVELHQDYSLPWPQALRVYDDVQRTYAHRWITVNYPSHQPFNTSNPVDPEVEMIVTTLQRLGFSLEEVSAGIERYNAWYNNGQPSEEIGLVNLTHNTQNGDMVDGAETEAGTDLEWNSRPRQERDGGGLRQMLYYIAEHQSREEGYIHRGVTCNSCDIKPIRGIRWRCANCPDFDICSDCEASDIHDKTHLFYKIKIPAPFFGNSIPPQPVAYPGKPKHLARYLSHEQRSRIIKDTTFEMHEVDALYDQFTCLANTPWPEDPNNLCGAIDRVAFDKAFLPIASSNTPRPNLIYDRMFAFYDVNSDGLIGFEEFLKGLACLHLKEKVDNRLKRVFEGYDLDADGYVCRKDFLRMFRAYYAIQKEIVRDVLAIQEAQDELTIDGAMEIITSSQPLSAAFTDPMLPPADTFRGERKAQNAVGDRRSGPSIVENSEDIGNRSEVVGNAWELQHGFPFDQNTGDPISDSRIPATIISDNGEVHTGHLSLSHQGRPVSEWRNDALRERWRRRQFYTDEEEGYVPPAGILEGEATGKKTMTGDPQGPALRHTPNGSGPVSPRSRSPSKVRFQDDIDAETRSNASTSSRPFNERFGGYEIPQLEKDCGQEVLYQVTQQGLNELLDPLFKVKEDLAMEVESTATERTKWRSHIEAFKHRKSKDGAQEGKEVGSEFCADTAKPNGTLTPETLAAAQAVPLSREALDEAIRHVEELVTRSELPDLLRQTGYTTIEEPSAESMPQRELNAASTHSPQQPPFELPNNPATTVSLSGNGELQVSSHSEAAQIIDIATDTIRGNNVIDTQEADPTLPQHRPNSMVEMRTVMRDSPIAESSRSTATEGQQLTSESVVHGEAHEESSTRFAALVLGRGQSTTLRVPQDAWHSGPSGPKPLPGTQANDAPVDVEIEPSEENLAKYARLDEAEEEILIRGGPGRLSYEEFERMMRSDGGRPLGFVEGWLELGSF